MQIEKKLDDFQQAIVCGLCQTVAVARQSLVLVTRRQVRVLAENKLKITVIDMYVCVCASRTDLNNKTLSTNENRIEHRNGFEWDSQRPVNV